MESDDVEKLKSKPFPQHDDQSHGVNPTLTVGGLNGTGHFLGSRADDFAESLSIKREHGTGPYDLAE